MKLSLKVVAGLLFFSFAACNGPTNFVGRQSIFNKKKSADQTTSTNVDQFSLTVTTSDQQPQDPIELLFLLDNSRSMYDNIIKLRESTGHLFDELEQANLPYNARILTMDLLLDQLETVDQTNGMGPPNLFSGNKANYNRGNNDSHYTSVGNFTNGSGKVDFLDKLSEVAADDLFIENEPGICLAMDYVNWLENNEDQKDLKKYSSKQKLHVIVLSDEDNAETFNTYNHNNNKLVSKQDLYCSGERKVEQRCENIETLTDKFCYTYDESYNQKTYNYKGTYTSKGICQKLGVVADNEVDSLEQLYAKKWCVKSTDRLTCDEFRNETRYSCNASDDSVVSTYDWSANGGSKKLRCDEAQKFDCLQLYDGQEVWEPYNRATALNMISQGAECRVSQSGPDWKRATIFATTSGKAGISSCEEYDCSPFTKEVSRRRVTINETAFNAAKHENCVEASPYKRYSSFYNLDIESSAILKGISENCCAAGYSLEILGSPKPLSSARLCGNTVDNHLPRADISRNSVGTSSTVSRSYNKNYSYKRTKAQLASYFGVGLNELTFTETITSDNKILHKNLGCFDYQKFPPGSQEYTQKLHFVEDYEAIASITKICDDPIITETKIKPTPGEFVGHMKQSFPARALTWHSIVNIDGKSCNGYQETNVAKGESYIQLSESTGGVWQNICSDSFDPFIEAVTLNVLTEVVITYKIPEEKQGRTISQVENLSTQALLTEGDQYWIEGEFIVFDKSVINKGDLVNISFE